MRELRYEPGWFDDIKPGGQSDTIVTTLEGRVGLGAFLIIRCQKTGRLLVGRKSFRPDLDTSDQFTFPGGMVRSGNSSDSTFEHWLYDSLNIRLRSEVGLELSDFDSIAPLDHMPPYVGSYTVKGKWVTTAVMAFYGLVSSETHVSVVDDTVYDFAWRNESELWGDISPSNGLALANLVWHELGENQKHEIKELLMPSYQRHLSEAAALNFHSPVAPWE